jgi:hypothetical protein
MPRRAGDGKQSSINHGAAVIALETPSHSKAAMFVGVVTIEDVCVSLNELVKGKSWALGGCRLDARARDVSVV